MVDALAETILLALTTALTRAFMNVVTGSVCNQIEWPSDELLSDQSTRSENRCLLHQLG